MLARGILGSGRTRGVSFWPFPNSSGWWWLISSLFLIRISCHKTTHANSYYSAWPGRVVSISVLLLTVSSAFFLCVLWSPAFMVGTFSNILQPFVVCPCLRRKVWKADYKYGVKLGRMCGLLAFPTGSADKESPCSARDTGDASSMPGLGKSPGGGNGNLLQYSSWRITWTEDPGRLQSKGLPRVGHDWVTKHTQTHTHTHTRGSDMGAPLMSVFSKVRLRVCYNKLVNITKMKQTHRYREQTSGYHREAEWRRDYIKMVE